MICTLEGPEDDSIRIETYCPNTIINIIKFCCVWLTHHCIFIYVLNTSGWQTLKKGYFSCSTVHYNSKHSLFESLFKCRMSWRDFHGFSRRLQLETGSGVEIRSGSLPLALICSSYCLLYFSVLVSPTETSLFNNTLINDAFDNVKLLDSSWNVMAHGDAREGKWRWKLANAVGSQYSSHYLGTWCIQHYYRWCAHLGCQ